MENTFCFDCWGYCLRSGWKADLNPLAGREAKFNLPVIVPNSSRLGCNLLKSVQITG